VAFAKTWQGVLTFAGTLLAIIVIPLLIEASSAAPDTPLGRMRERVTAYLSGNDNAPITPRFIDKTEFLVNGVVVEDITQPYITDTRQISIEVQARDADGKSISEGEILCEWTFDPPLPPQAFREENGCRTSYQAPENLDSQLVEVEARGKDRVTGTSTSSINIIILQSDEGPLNEK
jgi:hypothetical protein